MATLLTLFTTGIVVSTKGALAALLATNTDPKSLIERHLRGDWGIVDPEDAAANDAAVRDGDRILSAYVLSNGVKVWVITEADRSSTCILLPDEY